MLQRCPCNHFIRRTFKEEVVVLLARRCPIARVEATVDNDIVILCAGEEMAIVGEAATMVRSTQDISSSGEEILTGTLRRPAWFPISSRYLLLPAKKDVVRFGMPV